MSKASFEHSITKKVYSFELPILIVIFLTVTNFIFAQFVPDLLYPHPNEVTKENNITFKWNKDVQNTLTYQFQLTTNASFSSLISDQSTVNNSISINGLTNYGQMHYWRVRSSQDLIVSNWSAVDSFFLFIPTSISGLSVWLDPNNGVVLSGANVQALNDNTTNINDAIQTAPTQRPLFVSSDSLINNKSIMRFDGIDDFLEIADNSTIDFVDQFSIHVIVKPSIIATNKAIIVKWDYQTQGSWGFQSDFNTPDELMYAPANILADAGASKVITTNADMLINKPALLNLVFNGNLSSKVKYYKNFTSLNTSSINNIPSIIPNSSATLKIAKWGGIVTRYYQGDIGEILIYNTELPTVQKTLVDNYLRYKYAPPVSLGPDTLTNQNTLCTNIILKAQSKYQTYLWSTGSSESSINVILPGEYWVTVTDFLGNISSDTIHVYSMEIPLPPTTGICVNEAIVWNADMGPSFTYLWSTGETSPSITISTPGTYSVQVTDAFACTRNSGPVNFTMDNYSQTTYLGNDTSLCTGNLIALQIGAAETVSYIWPDASTLPQYIVDTTGNYFVESTNVNGCVAQDTIFVTIAGTAPAAAFSSQNACLNTVSTFTDQSVPVGADNIAIWNWDMGDGSPLLTSQNPSYTFATSGTYTVLLYVESAGGCGAYQSSEIQIYANPTSNFTYLGHCAGQDVQFTNTSTDGSTPITNYLWNFDMPLAGADNTSTIPNPNLIYDDPGTYNVSFQVIDGNSCTDTVIVPVIIDPSPVANFTYAVTCVNTENQFTNTSVTDPLSTYFWDFGNGTNSIEENPSKVFSFIGTLSVSLQVTNTSACSTTVQDSVQVFPTPDPVMDLSPYCKDSYMEVYDLSTIVQGSIDSSVWMFNTINTQSGSPASFLIPSLGQQQIQLTTYSDEGCSATTSQFIDVTTALNVSFTAQSIGAVGEPIDFINTSTGTTIALWDFGDGQFSSDFNPSNIYGASYTDSIVEVYLTSLNTQGCRDTAHYSITIQQAKLDLELSQAYVQRQGAWYVVGVKMVNLGSETIKNADLNIETRNGILFNETWSGTLSPLQSYIYVFTAQVNAGLSFEYETEAFICVNGIGYNFAQVAETNLDNNTVCRNVEGENVILVPIYPNPASETTTVQLIVTVASEVSLGLYDLRGRIIKDILPTQKLPVGTHIYSVNVDQISEGEYYVRLLSGESSQMQKVIVVNVK